MDMKVRIRLWMLNALALLLASGLWCQVSIVSWNIQDMGRTKSDTEIAIMAQVLKDYDVVAIQEVVAGDPAGAQAVGRLGEALKRTGGPWEYRISDPTDSPSSYIRERYAFLWRGDKVQNVGRPFLDRELAPVIYREPFLIRLKVMADGTEFLLVNYHSRRFDEGPEEEIIYLTQYPRRSEGMPVVIAGDFNLGQDHPVFEPLYDTGYRPALNGVATTLKRSCDEYGAYLNHAIDNIFVPPGMEVMKAYAIDLVGSCDLLELARKLSDHLPVVVEVE